MKFKVRHLIAAVGTSLLLVLAGTPTVQAASSSNSSQSEMRNFVRSTLANNHVRGTVEVIKNGQAQQISYGYGYYGRRLGAGNSKVVYPTCSLQKVLTAAMMTQLIYETKSSSKPITQYTKISRWYPSMKNAKNISVGNLMTHTSGILASATEVNRGHNESENQAVNWVVKQVNSQFSVNPGNYYYNNANYILLAGIIRKQTGQSYATNFTNRIVKPLGLNRTYLYQQIPFATKTDAISYLYQNGKNYRNAAYVKRTQASQLVGAANLFSTPSDYYKMLIGLTNGKILTKHQYNYMTHLKTKIADYSGGVYLKNNDLQSAYGNLSGTHFGNWFQMTTDDKYGMIMFLNQSKDNEDQNKTVGAEILNHIKANTFSAR